MPLIDMDYLILGLLGAAGMTIGFLLMMSEPSTTAFTTVGTVLLVGGGLLIIIGLYRYLSFEPRPKAPPVPKLRPASIPPAYVALALKRAGRRPEEFGIGGEVG